MRRGDGAAYRGRPVGALGRAGSFSFQSSKNLTCGEGGAIVTSDEAFAAACRSLHNCGRVPGGVWYEHHRLGGNYRLSEFQGAVLNGQLDRFASQLELRERNGRHLARELGKISGLLPQVRPTWAHVNANGTLAGSSGGVTSASLGVDGQYSVNFGRNVSQCAYVATIDFGDSANEGEVSVSPRDGNAKAVFVQTFLFSPAMDADMPFYLAVFC